MKTNNILYHIYVTMSSGYLGEAKMQYCKSCDENVKTKTRTETIKGQTFVYVYCEECGGSMFHYGLTATSSPHPFPKSV